MILEFKVIFVFLLMPRGKKNGKKLISTSGGERPGERKRDLLKYRHLVDMSYKCVCIVCVCGGGNNSP